MGFKPLAFGLLSGDGLKESVQNAMGSAGIAGKLIADREKEKAEEALRAGEEVRALQAAKAARAGQGMKKGGSVKGWGIARGARKAKTY